MVCRDSPDKPCGTIDPNFGTMPCNTDADCTIANPATSIVALNDRCGAPDSTKPNEKYCLQTACAQNVYIGDNCRDAYDKDVNPMTTKCAPLELNGLYRVAVNNYIAQGGSGFVVLKRNTSQQDTGVSLRDALTVFLSNQTESCDGTDIHDIMDSTDTQIPQRSVFTRYGSISCLDDMIEPHDGRIRPVFLQ
jgi:hypothetical protein